MVREPLVLLLTWLMGVSRGWRTESSLVPMNEPSDARFGRLRCALPTRRSLYGPRRERSRMRVPSAGADRGVRKLDDSLP